MNASRAHAARSQGEAVVLVGVCLSQDLSAATTVGEITELNGEWLFHGQVS
ncbi:MAG: hypothetical protein ABIJ50_09605 [Pseudomonadota bacterium]